MNNKYLRGLVFLLAGLVIVVAALFLGDVIARAVGGQEVQGVRALPLERWWVLIRNIGLVMYALYALLGSVEMLRFGRREIMMMALGAGLYGVLCWVFNIVHVPAIVQMVSLRPVVVVPIFFGAAFGPVVGFFSGMVGNVLGDALTGWGVFPLWDIGNGLMGMIAGLAGMYLASDARRKTLTQILLWVCAAILALGMIVPLISPSIVVPSTGQVIELGAWWYVMLVVLAVMLVASLVPLAWPYLLILLTLAFIGFGVVEWTTTGFSMGIVVVWIVGAICAAAAWYVNSRVEALSKWLSDEDTRTIVVWGTLGVLVGIAYPPAHDVIYAGQSILTAFVGQYVPRIGPNVLFTVILTPLLYAVWKQIQLQAKD